jgi:hypothetical protein
MILAFIVFPFIVLAFFDFSLSRTPFSPFTKLLRKIWREVTGKFILAGFGYGEPKVRGAPQPITSCSDSRLR